MYSELEEKCGSLYNSNQQFFSTRCKSLMYDAEYTKDRVVEPHDFMCSIVGKNVTSIVKMIHDTENNTICPEGGWCNITNNRFNMNNPNISEISIQDEYGNLTELCPRIIPLENTPENTPEDTTPEDTSENTTPENTLENTTPEDTTPEDTSENTSKNTSSENTLENTQPEQSSVESLCQAQLLDLNYNNNCPLIKQDNDMVASLCGFNSDGNINWKSEGDKMYCENDDYSLHNDVNDNNLTCTDGINQGKHLTFKIIRKAEPEYTIFCPAGYCSKSDGTLNTDNIDKIRDSINKIEHPFCTN